MDARRPPPYAHPPPPPPPPPPPSHHHHPHQQHPPPVDRQPPPPFAQPSNTPHAHHSAPHPSYAPGAPVPTLPPIHPSHAPPGHAPGSHNLPSFHHPPPPPHVEQRDPSDFPAYNGHHSRSSHATPAPVSRSFSQHDSPHQQRTPTTPIHPGPGPSSHPVASAPDGAHHMDHGGHHAYPPTNGVHPHGMPHSAPPQHHEQSQYQMTPVMENHHPYPPQSQSMYPSQSYGPASQSFANVQKRKQMRATQACEQCRQRKQKCDEGNPCSFCKENSLSCQYRDTPPAKTDKNMERLLQYMESHSSALAHLTTKVDDFDRRLHRVEHTRVPSTVKDPEPEEDEPPKVAGELQDHRTAPHKLILLWPSVAPLLSDAGVNVSDSYVMEAEDRGILRIWTRGEGIDEHDGTQPGGPASPALSEDSGEGSAASPPDGLWGTGFPQTPLTEARRSEPYSLGGLRPDGSPDLDVATINMLYDSYMANLHIMHPFLDKQRLRKLFDHFIKRYSTGNQNNQHRRSKFAVPDASDMERPMKRQRSNGSTATGMPGYENINIRREPTERSPGNAIVWLVLALGKICLHKEPLPGAVPDGKLKTNTVISHQLTGNPGLTDSSPTNAAIKPQPLDISPRSTPTTHPTPPMDGIMRVEPRSRRTSGQGGVFVAGPRNIDVVPGLAYYAKAAEIMGDQGDGNDLVHAQMFLLAGLYKGQLARVKESMSWYNMAGRAIRMLLDRYKLYVDSTTYGDIRKRHESGQARIKDKRHNLIVLASWTCLQLESDILAEMRLPSSGIGNFENMLLMPHNMPDSESENYEGLDPDPSSQQSYGKILLFYTAQTFLRRRLNQVHKEMYGDHCLNQPLSQVKEMLSGHERTIRYWRETLPEGLHWHDNDPPSSDILEARLRAKYWGSKYIINRPFLDYALHIMPYAKEGHSIESAAKDCHGNPRDKAEVHLFKAIQLMGESEIWEASKRCIDAAMQSTVALDGVPDRLVVTNIHGTAHAQFGNMLVLSAAHYNKWLNTLVQTDRFQLLLERTIQFLRRLGPISPTCGHDCSILERINRLIFGVSPTEQHVYRNEGYEPQSANASFNRSEGVEPRSISSSFGHGT